MSLKALQDYTLYSRYSKYLSEKKRRETWKETVDRVFDMHEKKFAQFFENSEFKELFFFAKEAVLKKRVLGSQRALQCGGKPIEKHNSKIFNCSALYIDKAKAFQDICYLLLSGCGVGFGIEYKDINKLPRIKTRTRGSKSFQIPDSIEGWADSVGVLLSSYFEDGGTFSEYRGHKVEFDFSLIRPEGALIANQFKAPGSEPLKLGLKKMEELIDRCLNNEQERLRPIDVYDILMHASDFVLSSGLRRSATICLFDKNDQDMMKAKTGRWFIENPQRGRSNNSVILRRGEVDKNEFLEIFNSIKFGGEPGFYFVDDEALTNPCCLHGDTEIFTTKGKISISDLVKRFNDGEQFDVISFNIDTEKYEISPVKSACLTKKNTDFLEVIFQNQDCLEDLFSVFCTPDHKFYDRNNKEYIEAQDIYDGMDFTFLNGCTTARLNQIFKCPDKFDAYDIEVDGNSNFFANGVLVHNCEIGFYPKLPSGETGTAFCNLTEINGKKCKDRESFLEACKASAIIGTLQTCYDKFPYLGEATEKILEYERLLGCSITGWMDSPEILFNEQNLKDGVKIIKEINEKLAKILGINPSARLTCSKPAGSTSCMLSTASGIHPHHAKRYFRRVQANKLEFPAQKFYQENPLAVEESVWSANNTDLVLTFLCEVPQGSIIKNQISAIELLEKVKFAQKYWVLEGTIKERGLSPSVTHNISNTITVKEEEWEEVAGYIWENKQYFAGVSLLPSSGDKDYPQAPFCTVYTQKELVDMYGEATLFASGLIVDGLKAFDNNLWKACDSLLGVGEDIEPLDDLEADILKRTNAVVTDTDTLKRDWVRRAIQFAHRYFEDDLRKMTYCLKDVLNLKVWVDLKREYKDIDWSQVVEEDESFVEINTLGALSCSGNSCTINI